MKLRLAVLFTILLASTSYASPPSRSYVYTAGDPILSSEVSANEDSIFNYLQQGVDNIYDGVIVNADINASANIAASKLNLTSIAQNIVNTGTLTNNGSLVVGGGGTIEGIGAVPIGGIILWSGTAATVPTGWEVSDGTCVVTCPDLRDRFVVGTGPTYAVGTTGGAATINLAHDHGGTATAGGTLRPDGGVAGTGLDGGTGNVVNQTISSALSAAQSVLNPYFSLIYIIRVQ
jgi:hypothetical protein